MGSRTWSSLKAKFNAVTGLRANAYANAYAALWHSMMNSRETVDDAVGKTCILAPLVVTLGLRRVATM
jgi:hypothetical protein